MANTSTPLQGAANLTALALCASTAVLKRLHGLVLDAGVQIVARLAGFREAGSLVRSFEPNVLILEWAGPEEDEDERIEELALLSRSLPVVCLVRRDNVGLRQRLLDAGVLGLLPAEASAQELSLALKSARAQLVVIHPSLLGAEFAPASARANGEQLTPREVEVLQLMAQGFSNREIGGLLHISNHTVKFHVSSVLGKLDVSTRAEAVVEGVRRGVITV
jgi:two-component system, NarL family, response regulator YdfI